MKNTKTISKSVFFLLALAAFFVGCSAASKEEADLVSTNNSNIISIDESTITDSLNVSDMIAEIEVIPLVEEDPYFFSQMQRIYYNGIKYIVYDQSENPQILLFNEDGTFDKKVLGKGRGPGEAVMFRDAWLNSDGSFDAYDFYLQKIFHFNKNFELEKEIPTGRERYYNLIRIPGSEKFLAYSTLDSDNPKFNGKNYQFAILNQDLEKETGFLPFSDAIKGSSTTNITNHYHVYNDSIRFFRHYDNTIYHLQGNELVKWASIDYQDRPLDYPTFEKIVEENPDVFKKKGNISNYEETKELLDDFSYFDGPYVENANYIIFASNLKSGAFTSIYDKKGKQVIANTKMLYEDQKYNMILPELTATGDGYFIGFIHPDLLKYYLLDESPLENYVDPENPRYLLVKVKFKE